MNLKFFHSKIFLSLIIIQLIIKILSKINQKDNEKTKGISDINVLLPICDSSNCNRVSFQVEAYGGCFEWKLDKPEFIDLELINGPNESLDCVSKTRISPKNVYDTNHVVFLQAKDRNTNELFTCRIGFGKIKKIKIVKRFDVINVGEIVDLDVKV